MKCLEIIELRSFNNNCQALENELNDLLNAKPESIKIYRHSSVPTHLRVHILSDFAHAEVKGSPLGILLASAFEEFGIVNHNVWIEKGRREKRAWKIDSSDSLLQEAGHKTSVSHEKQGSG